MPNGFLSKWNLTINQVKYYFNYIEIFYNRKRRHSANGEVSPSVFEENVALAA